ncbi:MAG: hypothetical protein KDK34_02935 [Leptospiraceae bacterium]|nr:hypothetical protein [Leptospiraceae bacterium]
MSERSRNDLPKQVAWVGHSPLHFAYVTFLLPLPFILAEIYLGPRQSYFNFHLFLGGTILELCLDMLAYHAVFAERISRRRFLFYRYLIRTALGLPFSVYLILGMHIPIIGMLRYLPTLRLLRPLRNRRQFIWHLVLFAVGYCAYLMLRDFNWPSIYAIITGCVYVGVGALYLLREQEAQEHIYNERLNQLDQKRLLRRQSLQLSHARGMLATIVPSGQLDGLLMGAESVPVLHACLCVQMRFLHFRAGVRSYLDSPDYATPEQALRDFQREYFHMQAFIRESFPEPDYLVSGQGDAVLAVRPLQSDGQGQATMPIEDKPIGSVAAGEGPGLSTADLQTILNVILKARQVLQYVQRTQRTLAARARRWPDMGLTLSLEQTVRIAGGHTNPTPVILSAAKKEIRDFPADPDIEHRANRIWLAPELAGPFQRCFLEEVPAVSGWFCPGLLRPEYSVQGRGLEPVADIIQRLSYSV